MSTPTPDLAGKFAIFYLPDGSAKAILQMQGEDPQEHTIPAFVVMMFKDAMEGKVPPMIAGLFGE